MAAVPIMIAGDAVLTAAMLDRILRHSTIINIKWRELSAQGQAQSRNAGPTQQNDQGMIVAPPQRPENIRRVNFHLTIKLTKWVRSQLTLTAEQERAVALRSMGRQNDQYDHEDSRG